MAFVSYDGVGAGMAGRNGAGGHIRKIYRVCVRIRCVCTDLFHSFIVVLISFLVSFFTLAAREGLAPNTRAGTCPCFLLRFILALAERGNSVGNFFFGWGPRPVCSSALYMGGLPTRPLMRRWEPALPANRNGHCRWWPIGTRCCVW